jgi:hypothetical protein
LLRSSGFAGNEIRYQVTIEDPEVRAESRVTMPWTIQASPFPDAALVQGRPSAYLANS